MTRIERSALVAYSAAQMYEVVNDVASYPQFLAGCESSEVHEASESHMLATLVLVKAGLRYQFTTRNQLVAGQSISMQLQQGPFQQLEGEWRFQSLTPQACKVALTLSFVLDSQFKAAAAEHVFGQLANAMVDAFCEQAVKKYGRR